MFGKKTIKSFLLATALFVTTSVLTLGAVSCNGGSSNEYVDYAKTVQITTADWKTGNYIKDGVGPVDLEKCVDGDTAHFSSNGHIVQGRFNGINTPESTGVLEKWGKAASNFTKEKLESAKTIVLESEPLRTEEGPEQDSNGRYLVWVWVSERELAEEDGSELYLLNLQIVQEGFSGSKKAGGSKYSDPIYNADMQAQRLKLHLYSDEKDPLYYEGSAVVDEKDVYQHPENYVDKKVYVTGTVTRTLGDNAYIQKDIYDEEGNLVGTYGLYIFTMYKRYDILKKGNEISVIGTIAERFGNYQLINVKYSNIDALRGEDDMTLLSSGNKIEPKVITAAEASDRKYMGNLVKIENLVITGGYGGYDNNYNDCINKGDATPGYCENNSKNAMTLFAKQTITNENGEEVTNKVQIRIDNDTFIKDIYDSKVTDYKYFVGKKLTLTGIMGMYKNENNDSSTYQLMLLATSDVTYVTE